MRVPGHSVRHTSVWGGFVAEEVCALGKYRCVCMRECASPRRSLYVLLRGLETLELGKNCRRIAANGEVVVVLLMQ